MTEFHGTTSEVYPDIIDHLAEREVTESRAGDTREDRVITVVSENPRERMLFRPKVNWAFGLQEAFAYWTGKNPGHVQRYNSKMADIMYQRDDEDKLKLHGSAYGRYLRHLPHDQIERVISQLRENPDTRRALINIHNAAYEDYDRGDVACTIYLQFLIRDEELHCIANLRSQDMLWGYPYDVHAFQWIQEVLAGILDVGLGTYTHIMNSSHYYIEFEEEVLQSAREASWVEGPDVRLSEYSLQRVILAMKQALRRVRDGQKPREEIEVLETVSQYYADWVRTMWAYEHNDSSVEVETAPFAEYL